MKYIFILTLHALLEEVKSLAQGYCCLFVYLFFEEYLFIALFDYYKMHACCEKLIHCHLKVKIKVL